MKLHGSLLSLQLPRKPTATPLIKPQPPDIPITTTMPVSPQTVMHLQRTHGNAFTRRLIAQAKSSPPQVQRVLELEENTPLKKGGRKIKHLRMTSETEFKKSVPKAQLGDNRWRKLLIEWAKEPVDDTHTVHKYKNIAAALDAAKTALRKNRPSSQRKQEYRNRIKAEALKTKGRNRRDKLYDRNWAKMGKVAHRANLAHLKGKAETAAKIEALRSQVKTGGVIDMPPKSIYRTMLLYFDATSSGVTVPRITVDDEEKKQPVKFKMGGVDAEIGNTSTTSEGTMANTHVRLIGTSNTSAYSEMVFKDIPLPLQNPSNDSQNALNALEAVRNAGAFLPSQVTKQPLLSQGKITPQEAIAPEQYGTFEMQGVSGNHRDYYADLVNQNTSNLVNKSEAEEVEIGKKLKEQFAIIIDESKSGKQHFDAYKQCVRLMDIEIPKITGDDPLTPPSTPMIQEAFDSVLEEERIGGEKEVTVMSEDEDNSAEDDKSEDEDDAEADGKSS